jgi:phosphonoacetaldehyde hydrolase
VNRVEAVILDWAGTTVDCGCLAPVRAMTKLFEIHGIALSETDARRDMGLFKKDHIRRILSLPEVRRAWREAHRQTPDETDVASLFVEFGPIQQEILEERAELIGGVAALAGRLAVCGLKLGSTTGYTKPMLSALLARATKQGYRPDLSLCPDDVGGGRPHPWMCWQIALEFRLSSTAAAIKAGDTVSDIEEARNSGMWAVGVAATGNEVGLSEPDLAALPPEERARQVERACHRLRAAGAHFVIDSVAELEPVIEEIDRRLSAGERP